MRTYAKVTVLIIVGIFFISPISNGLPPGPAPPITEIFFDEESGFITLVAVDYGWPEPSGVNTTYFEIDDGPEQIYHEPFKLPEGLHIVYYWSVDNIGLIESKNSAEYICDTITPTVDIISPTIGIYILGLKIMPFGNDIICIGGAPIIVDADDGDGTGINYVYFTIMNDTGYDSEPPYEYTFNSMNFGDLTITAYAEDKKGLFSEPVELTIKCYCLGLL
jgi:hypothetical protein